MKTTLLEINAKLNTIKEAAYYSVFYYLILELIGEIVVGFGVTASDEFVVKMLLITAILSSLMLYYWGLKAFAMLMYIPEGDDVLPLPFALPMDTLKEIANIFKSKK